MPIKTLVDFCVAMLVYENSPVNLARDVFKYVMSYCWDCWASTLSLTWVNHPFYIEYPSISSVGIGSSLQWRHNGHDGVSNHQPHNCLLNCIFGRKSKKTSKLRVTGLCDGNSPATGEVPAQMASNAENVVIWWRHHVKWVVQTWWKSASLYRCVSAGLQ